jgi:hypothetical protein
MVLLGKISVYYWKIPLKNGNERVWKILNFSNFMQRNFEIRKNKELQELFEINDSWSSFV